MTVQECRQFFIPGRNITTYGVNHGGLPLTSHACTEALHRGLFLQKPRLITSRWKLSQKKAALKVPRKTLLNGKR